MLTDQMAARAIAWLMDPAKAGQSLLLVTSTETRKTYLKEAITKACFSLLVRATSEELRSDCGCRVLLRTADSDFHGIQVTSVIFNNNVDDPKLLAGLRIIAI